MVTQEMTGISLDKWVDYSLNEEKRDRQISLYQDSFDNLDLSSKEYMHIKSIKITEKDIGTGQTTLESRICIKKIEELFQNLKRNSGIRSLSFCSVIIEEKEVEILAKSILSNSTIKSLELDSIKLNDKTLNLFTDCLRSNKGITDFDVGGNDITGENLDKFIEALNSNKSITHLGLSGNPISETGMESIAKILVENQAITSINLSGIKLNNEKMKKLAEALKLNRGIQKLDLSYCEMKGEGLTYLADALESNQSVNWLDIEVDEYDSEEHMPLAKLLRLNQSITYLNCEVEDSAMAPEDEIDIAKSLRVNKALKALCLSNLSTEGSLAIFEALKVNTSITALDLQYLYLDTPSVKSLCHLIKSNTVINTMSIAEFNSNESLEKQEKYLENINDAICSNRRLTKFNAQNFTFYDAETEDDELSEKTKLCNDDKDGLSPSARITIERNITLIHEAVEGALELLKLEGSTPTLQDTANKKSKKDEEKASLIRRYKFQLARLVFANEVLVKSQLKMIEPNLADIDQINGRFDEIMRYIQTHQLEIIGVIKNISDFDLSTRKKYLPREIFTYIMSMIPFKENSISIGSNLLAKQQSKDPSELKT